MTQVEVFKGSTGCWGIRVDGVVVKGGFSRKRDAEPQVEVAKALVAAFEAATTKRYSALEEAAMRLCWEYEYAQRDLRCALASVQDSVTRDLTRLDSGWEIFHDGTSIARSGAEIGIAAAKLKVVHQSLCSLLWATAKTEPTGDVAVVMSIFRFFRGAEVRQ